ncbi:MAG: hypothetical protein VB138_06645 [Burkholderia sp.]
MTQKFRFSGKAEILHLNARKEGPDDDKQLAVDVKLRAVTTMAVLHYFDDMLGQLFYTDIGAVRNTMIGPIPMKHELEDYRLEVKGGTHHGVKLKKFALEAMDDGMVSITFQASFKPSGDEVAQDGRIPARRNRHLSGTGERRTRPWRSRRPAEQVAGRRRRDGDAA